MSQGALLQYVILWHDGVPEPHFDLMVETSPGSPLATWRVARWPVDSPAPAVRLKDHRCDFLEYEGELTSGRGRATRVAAGECRVEIEGEGMLRLALEGTPPRSLSLHRVTGDQWEVRPHDTADADKNR